MRDPRSLRLDLPHVAQAVGQAPGVGLGELAKLRPQRHGQRAGVRCYAEARRASVSRPGNDLAPRFCWSNALTASAGNRGARPTRRWLVLATTMAVPALALPSLLDNAEASDSLWKLLRGGGQVILMRHADTTPGVGDPLGFRLDDCATQRNLTEAGRQAARRIGAAFRDGGIPVGPVLSSRWCRCLETARLAFGRSEPWAPLDSNFEDRSREPERTAAIRARASQWTGKDTLILVTHGANIVPLTGSQPSPGEFFVLTPEGGGRFRVAGRLPSSALP